MIRIVIAGGGTGGHLMPALALAEALKAERSEVEPVLVGAVRGVEARVLPERPYRYHLLPVEPIYRRNWWKNLRWPLIWWQVRRECERVLDAEQPVLVLGTGGYVAGPLLLRARHRGIPLALQEQNAYPGLTTRWLARHARQVHLGFPEARDYLRVGRGAEIHMFGNPITPPPDPRPRPELARRQLGIAADRPVLFIMGGSQGALRINQAVARALEAGAFDQLSVLWSVGPGMWERYRRYDAPPARLLRPFWDPISEAYAAADLVVARSGAMTTAELCAWGLPSVLVPLRTAAADHQTRNAQALAGAGAAVHLAESDLRPGVLEERVRGLFAAPPRLERMRGAALARAHPDAAREIARRLLALVS